MKICSWVASFPLVVFCCLGALCIWTVELAWWMLASCKAWQLLCGGGVMTFILMNVICRDGGSVGETYVCARALVVLPERLFLK